MFVLGLLFNAETALFYMAQASLSTCVLRCWFVACLFSERVAGRVAQVDLWGHAWDLRGIPSTAKEHTSAHACKLSPPFKKKR